MCLCHRKAKGDRPRFIFVVSPLFITIYSLSGHDLAENAILQPLQGVLVVPLSEGVATGIRLHHNGGQTLACPCLTHAYILNGVGRNAASPRFSLKDAVQDVKAFPIDPHQGCPN